MLPDSSRIVEQGQPLSQSFIWGLQAKFYESLGIDAWLSGVIPSTITTNAYIARTYARLIASYLADVAADDVTIVELGAGHGRFGFQCVQHLRELAGQDRLPTRRWKYVMTDVAERNLEFWQRHEALAPLVDEGVLDFARFEAGVDNSIRLRSCGAELGAGNKVSRLVIIGNYFFDSLPIDVWQVREGQLFECLPVLKLRPDADCTDTSDVRILAQLQPQWEQRPVCHSQYVQDEINELVEHFRGSLQDATLTIPVGALATLNALEGWSQSGSLALIADKGYLREPDLEGRPLPTMVQHGCFSFSVNFAALARWYQLRGGQSFLPSQRNGVLEMGAFITEAADQRTYGRLREEFSTGVDQFGPGDFHSLTRRDVHDPSQLSLEQAIAFLRLAACDPGLLYAWRRPLRRQIGSASTSQRRALSAILNRASELYYRLDDRDVPFTLASFHQLLGNHESAANWYRESLRLFGDHPTTQRNLATCLAESGATDVQFAF